MESKGGGGQSVEQEDPFGKQHTVLYTVLCGDDIVSSIRDFSWIWSPGGFDLGSVQAGEREAPDGEVDDRELQVQLHQVDNPVSYSEKPESSGRFVG